MDIVVVLYYYLNYIFYKKTWFDTHSIQHLSIYYQIKQEGVSTQISAFPEELLTEHIV